VGWTYTVADDATDYLVDGETVTESFTVTIADAHGYSRAERDQYRHRDERSAVAVADTLSATEDTPVM
jgi:VCBS repeat-containing protein